MTKNIQVVDETGRSFGTTYEKRAKGLVKNGRARYLGAETICLTRPPSIKEEPSMSEINQNTTENTINIQNPANRPLEFTLESVLSRIDLILHDTDYIRQAIDSVRSFPVNDSQYGGTGDSSRADAIGNAVKAREETNRKLLDLLEKMYEDLKPARPSIREKALDLVERTINNSALNTEDRESLTALIMGIQNLK